MDAFAKAKKKWETYRQAVEQYNTQIRIQISSCHEEYSRRLDASNEIDKAVQLVRSISDIPDTFQAKLEEIRRNRLLYDEELACANAQSETIIKATPGIMAFRSVEQISEDDDISETHYTERKKEDIVGVVLACGRSMTEQLIQQLNELVAGKNSTASLMVITADLIAQRLESRKKNDEADVVPVCGKELTDQITDTIDDFADEDDDSRYIRYATAWIAGRRLARQRREENADIYCEFLSVLAGELQLKENAPPETASVAQMRLWNRKTDRATQNIRQATENLSSISLANRLDSSKYQMMSLKSSLGVTRGALVQVKSENKDYNEMTWNEQRRLDKLVDTACELSRLLPVNAEDVEEDTA